jgi:hypothetical protein
MAAHISVNVVCSRDKTSLAQIAPTIVVRKRTIIDDVDDRLMTGVDSDATWVSFAGQLVRTMHPHCLVAAGMSGCIRPIDRRHPHMPAPCPTLRCNVSPALGYHAPFNRGGSIGVKAAAPGVAQQENEAGRAKKKPA